MTTYNREDYLIYILRITGGSQVAKTSEIASRLGVSPASVSEMLGNLADEGKSMIVVSSELDELLRICDNIIVMFDGKEVMTSSKENFNPDKILSVSVTGRNES